MASLLPVALRPAVLEINAVDRLDPLVPDGEGVFAVHDGLVVDVARPLAVVFEAGQVDGNDKGRVGRGERLCPLGDVELGSGKGRTIPPGKVVRSVDKRTKGKIIIAYL